MSFIFIARNSFKYLHYATYNEYFTHNDTKLA